MRLNLDYLIEKIWEHLNLIKVFTKKRGRKLNFDKITQLTWNLKYFIKEKPDLVDGIILRNGATVEAVVFIDLLIIIINKFEKIF